METKLRGPLMFTCGCSGERKPKPGHDRGPARRQMRAALQRKASGGLAGGPAALLTGLLRHRQLRAIFGSTPCESPRLAPHTRPSLAPCPGGTGRRGFGEEKGLELRRANRKGRGNKEGVCDQIGGGSPVTPSIAPPPRERSRGPGTCPPSLSTFLRKASLPASTAFPSRSPRRGTCVRTGLLPTPSLGG